MGKFSRDKGNRVERELVNDLRAEGFDAKRVPLSGATDYAGGDIDIRLSDRTLVGEVKARKAIPAWLTGWLGENDYLVIREDRQPPVVVLPMRTFTELLRAAEKGRV